MPETAMRQMASYDARTEFAQQTTRQILKEMKLDKAVGISYAYGTAIKGFSGEMDQQTADRLAADPRVAYVEQDQVATIVGGPPGGGGGGGGGGGQTTPWGIARVNGGANGVGKVAWIIDSGIDLNHPDLTVDVNRSKCFLDTSPNACKNGPEDENGHGTHVAGIVAAKDNTTGVIGVAAGASVVAVRVLDRNGSGSYSGVIAGVDYVTATAASGDAANMSLGGPTSSALDAAVIALGNHGVKLAMAAGNESTSANNSSPARANGNNIYTVSAMAQGDLWAYYSNYDNPPVDYCEPGSSIYSCYKNGGYATLSGTSMASPHLCGILLLLGNGNPATDGTVSGDPDGNPDPIAVH
ncbi:MAG: S8 family serine peptidase [Lewinellaceae bacterium]|nr:S8 family serine peptidase [Lewinellaceae bacterium]